jgi:hypothetical protein
MRLNKTQRMQSFTQRFTAKYFSVNLCGFSVYSVLSFFNFSEGEVIDC